MVGRAAAAHHVRARDARHHRPRVRPLRGRRHTARPVGLADATTASARTIDYLTDDDGDDGWTQRAVRQPFIWYGNAFMRITAAIKRRQEFAADAAAPPAARAATPTPRRCGASTRTGPSFDAYWENEVAAVLRAGKRPPVVDGFGEYLRSEPIDKAASEFLELQMKEETDRYDSHPSLSERLARAGGVRAGRARRLAAGDEAPPRARGARARAAGHRSSTRTPPSCRRSSGTTSPTRCTSRGRAPCAPSSASVLGDATVADLSGLAQDIGRDRRAPCSGASPSCRTRRRPTSPPTLLAEALLAALADDGWTVEAGLAEPVHACRGEEKIAPYDVVTELHDSGPAASAWRERATELGIADLRWPPPTCRPTPNRGFALRSPETPPGTCVRRYINERRPGVDTPGLRTTRWIFRVARALLRPGGPTPAPLTTVSRCGFRSSGVQHRLASGRTPPGSRNNCHSTSDHPLSLVGGE